MTIKIAVIDYDMGNLKSISKLLGFLKVPHDVTSNPEVILNSDGVILPGVGAFGDAMNNLRNKGLITVIQKVISNKKPLLGICLGLQLLFTKSYEMGEYRGLGTIKGNVVMFEKQKAGKVPQIGWNIVEFQDSNHYLIQGIPNKSYFYFVHSFYGVPENKNNILGITRYGEVKFASMIVKDNIVATQFHPEKSGTIGVKMVENFIQYCKDRIN